MSNGTLVYAVHTDRMLALYPGRANPGALWGGSKTAKPTHVIYQQAR
jgi:hypothetical protein